MLYTLGDAAKATGLTKPTLSKAIKSGKLSAVRNENGSYSIDPSELHRVFPPMKGNRQNACKPLQTETLQQLAELLEKEKEERERERRQQQETINDLRRRLDASEAAREAAAAETRRLTLLLTHQPPASTPANANETPPRPSFWRRLTGK